MFNRVWADENEAPFWDFFISSDLVAGAETSSRNYMSTATRNYYEIFISCLFLRIDQKYTFSQL
jgi:hypothetical protein